MFDVFNFSQPKFMVGALRGTFKHSVPIYDQEPEYLGTADYGRFVQEVTARERVLLARLGLGTPRAE